MSFRSFHSSSYIIIIDNDTLYLPIFLHRYLLAALLFNNDEHDIFQRLSGILCKKTAWTEKNC